MAAKLKAVPAVNAADLAKAITASAPKAKAKAPTLKGREALTPYLSTAQIDSLYKFGATCTEHKASVEKFIVKTEPMLKAICPKRVSKTTWKHLAKAIRENIGEYPYKCFLAMYAKVYGDIPRGDRGNGKGVSPGMTAGRWLNAMLTKAKGSVDYIPKAKGLVIDAEGLQEVAKATEAFFAAINKLCEATEKRNAAAAKAA